MRKIGLILICVLLITCKSEKSTETLNSESKYFTDSIFSKHLNEYRKHNIYLPKGFEDEKNYPIIYSTDGSKKIKKNNFIKKTLDSLINNQIIVPLIYVGSHSNSKIADSTTTKTGDGKKVYLQYRNFEYVSNQYSDGYHNPELGKRFENHMKYFNDELVPIVEKTYKQKLNKNKRYFYGVSNGAGFGMSLLNKHPNTIGTYLCFSTFGGEIKSNVWKENVEYPNLYLEYGSEEPFFLKSNAEFLQSKYEELGLFSEVNEFKGGHDYKKWNEKFIEIISKILPVE